MQMRTYDQWLTAVRQNAYLSEVPAEFRDYEMYLASVSAEGQELQFVEASLVDYAMCLTAVTFDGWALQHVPAQFRDYQMCNAAVLHNRHALEFVPEDLPGREFLEILASPR